VAGGTLFTSSAILPKTHQPRQPPTAPHF